MQYLVLKERIQPQIKNDKKLEINQKFKSLQYKLITIERLKYLPKKHKVDDHVR